MRGSKEGRERARDSLIWGTGSDRARTPIRVQLTCFSSSTNTPSYNIRMVHCNEKTMEIISGARRLLWRKLNSPTTELKNTDSEILLKVAG